MSDCTFYIVIIYYHLHLYLYYLFFFTDTATTEIYTLSLHDALPIYPERDVNILQIGTSQDTVRALQAKMLDAGVRSEEHTSELQSRRDLVCRLLLEKKKSN